MNLESNQGEQPEAVEVEWDEVEGNSADEKVGQVIPTDWILRYLRLLLIDYRFYFSSLFYFLFFFISLFAISLPRVTELVDELKFRPKKGREKREACVSQLAVCQLFYLTFLESK